MKPDAKLELYLKSYRESKDAMFQAFAKYGINSSQAWEKKLIFAEEKKILNQYKKTIRMKFELKQ